MDPLIVPSPKPEPVGPDTAAYAELYYAGCELRRRIQDHVHSTRREHGKGRRLDLLNRAALRARQLTASLAALSGLREVEL